MVTFQEAVRLFFKNYAVFSGRSSRSAYWWVVLFCFIVGCGISLLTLINHTFGQIVSYAWSLAILIPSLAIGVRRLHDVGKGGGWICINFIPLIGWIWYVVLCCQESEPFDNRFGAVPDATNQ